MIFRKLHVHLLLILLCLFFLLPILWVTASSFKDGKELFAWPPTLFPEKATFINYIDAFKRGNFGLYFSNSIFVAVASTLLTVVINTMAGFALAKYKFRGNTFILVMFLGTIMIPLEVIMIPIFQVLKYLHLYNTLWGIIIPPAATPTGVFLVRQYLLSVPDELLEAARIDGAKEWKIFMRLIVPIITPVISVIAIFSFMWRWNDYLWPLIVISDSKLYTVELAIANFSGQFDVDWTSLLAMSVVTMIPVIIVFLAFQRFFVKGIVMSGLK